MLENSGWFKGFYTIINGLGVQKQAQQKSVLCLSSALCLPPILPGDSFLSLVAQEEQSQGAGAGMGTDDGTYIVDEGALDTVLFL